MLGCAVQVADCTSSDNQKWYADRSQRLRSVSDSERCLDAGNLTSLQQCTGNSTMFVDLGGWMSTAACTSCLGLLLSHVQAFRNCLTHNRSLFAGQQTGMQLRGVSLGTRLIS
jgi:hypothetical protein